MRLYLFWDWLAARGFGFGLTFTPDEPPVWRDLRADNDNDQALRPCVY